jgi:alpha-N-acetylglucosamine transferase
MGLWSSWFRYSKFLIYPRENQRTFLPECSDCRWVDQFTKLHLWTLTEYDRIVYLDSDALPLVNTEELFQLELNQHSTTNPPFNYSFAAVNTLQNINGQPVLGGGFNAGIFIMKPDQDIFERLWTTAMDPGQPWNVHKDMEQGLLNGFFRTVGGWYRLDWIWNAKDMPDSYFERSKIVHSRYTRPFSSNIRWWLNDHTLVGPKQSAEWWRSFGQVEGFWEAGP